MKFLIPILFFISSCSFLVAINYGNFLTDPLWLVVKPEESQYKVKINWSESDKNPSDKVELDFPENNCPSNIQIDTSKCSIISEFQPCDLIINYHVKADDKFECELIIQSTPFYRSEFTIRTKNN